MTEKETDENKCLLEDERSNYGSVVGRNFDELGRCTDSNYAEILRGEISDGNFDVSFAKPIWFDPKLFKEGREFYQDYRFGCVTSMLVSLVMGLSFKSLLDVLVYTEKSETPKKAFWRYFHTGLHVDSWFTSDIFQKNSAGQKSIKKVRMIHRSVALNITKNKGKKAEGKWISQTDLSHTLIGFAGSILIAPSSFGVPDDSKLEGYIHYWRVLGYLHGIEDRFNPFGGSMQIAQNTIADVTGNCLLPALEAPPADFEKMVQAVCSWAGAKNGIIYYGLMIVHDHHHKMTRKMDLERLSRLMGPA